MSQPYLSVVIPAYNEALRIGKSLESIRRHFSGKPYEIELIVVDDGSTDAMPPLLDNARGAWPVVRVLRNPANQGKGYSVRRGVLEARGRLVLFTDADLSTPIEEVDRLMAALESSGADVVIGSRGLDRTRIGVHQPWWREIGGMVFNRIVQFMTRLKLRDTQCGFKLFRTETARKVFQAQRVMGFGFDPEILFLVQRMGRSIVEMPVEWNNDPASKVRIVRDTSRMFWELVLLRWRAWRGEYPKS
jgi:dolichyl-phosphate beta-glucosyltransferase